MIDRALFLFSGLNSNGMSGLFTGVSLCTNNALSEEEEEEKEHLHNLHRLMSCVIIKSQGTTLVSRVESTSSLPILNFSIHPYHVGTL